MPSVSPPQARLMRAVAHSPRFAAKVNVPQSVGREYVAADAGLLRGFRKPKLRRMAPHSQTHAGAFDEPSGMGGAYGGT